VSADAETFVLEIEWDQPGLPSLVGPFATRQEATEWGALNVASGTWGVCPLAFPYYTRPSSRERRGRES
jgi:hypothetical protein